MHTVSYPGYGPVVVTVPHDGDVRPTCRQRSEVARWTRDLRDEYTMQIGFRLADEIADRGQHPTLIAFLAHRAFVDVNRAPADEPFADVRLNPSYEHFHATVDAAVTQALRTHGRCLVIDLHGFRWSPGPETYDVVLGTDSHRTAPMGTDRALHDALAARDWRTVFSPDEARNVDRRYRGGWNVRRIPERFPEERVDAIQVEIHEDIRHDRRPNARNRFAVDLAHGIHQALYPP